MATEYEPLVARHYGRPDVRRGLERVVDLAGVDQFHTRGEQATLDLAALVRIEPGHHVAGRRPPGVHLLMGEDAVTMLENLGRNLAERRVEVVMAALLVP